MTLLFVIIVLALIFDYINGFHDAANSIATVVSTKVLTPFQAVIWAAFFNVVAYFIFQDHAVANTISKTVNKENDFKEVIKKREIYQVLEIATDKCEDAANVIESIIIKYA